MAIINFKKTALNFSEANRIFFLKQPFRPGKNAASEKNAAVFS